ncbi:NAD(P)-binding protein [Violaceomyces palustris]|uniref:NAD(P)-binding protein n=1 Tax=Violaceomyces palustris TaxID=1673888 RepID=A0ACD0P1V3_9BASI|nr:NAD(P)-binding protein [Violaceomyces palustris]
MPPTAQQIVVILGAGPGLGFGLAKVFSSVGHPVALLSRSLPRLEELAEQLNSDPLGKDGVVRGRARAYQVDATKEDSIRSAFGRFETDFQSEKGHEGARVHTGIFNPGGGFFMSGLLETKPEQLESAFLSQTMGGFLFSRAVVEAIKSRPDFGAKPSEEAFGNILISGATASLRGSKKLSAFAASKCGLRAIAQSAAREFHPEGIHVAHFIIDGLIVTERTDKMLGTNYESGTRMDTNDIAQVYLDVSRQKKSAWTHEIDLRPFSETF